MRALFVTQWFHPEPVEVPVSIPLGLRDAGLEVETLTGIPNYPSGTVQAPYRAWRTGTEELLGIGILRTPLYPSHDRSAIRRVANYVSWALSSTCLGAGRIRWADVCLVYSSPATAAIAPAIWGGLLRTPYVLMIQDVWPDSVTSSGMVGTGPAARVVSDMLNKFVNWTYRRANQIVVISPGMADLLESRGVPREKISVIFNWAADEYTAVRPSRRAARQEFGLDADSFVVTYAGNLGAAQGLDVLLDAAELLQRRDPSSKIEILIAGSGVVEERLRKQARSAGLTNVRFLGRLDATEMLALRSASDVQFASLVDDPLFAVTIPGKVQSILSAGQPLVLAIPGDAARIVTEHDAGWAVPPGDAEALADVLVSVSQAPSEVLRRKGENGRQLYERSMSREVGSRALAGVLAKAAGSSCIERT